MTFLGIETNVESLRKRIEYVAESNRVEIDKIRNEFTSVKSKVGTSNDVVTEVTIAIPQLKSQIGTLDHRIDLFWHNASDKFTRINDSIVRNKEEFKQRVVQINAKARINTQFIIESRRTSDSEDRSIFHYSYDPFDSLTTTIGNSIRSNVKFKCFRIKLICLKKLID